jgi:cardiolipin synthase (CMP-forming)
MGHYSARHILLVPNLVSLTRLPLAALFVAFVDTPWFALAVLLSAGATDMIDGWYARRFSQVTATGAVIDGITDKAFMATVVVSLILTDRLGVFGALLLATRELGELPLVLWWTLHQSKRRARAEKPRANAVGKLCTSIQFVAVSAALFEVTWLAPVLALSGLLGGVAAAYYWRRETRT